MQAEGIKKGVKHKLPVDFFMTLAAVFNPNSYSELSNRTLKNVWSYYFSLVFLSFCLMILLGAPVIANLRNSIGTELAKIETFDISLNMTLSEPINFERSKIRMDFDKMQPDDERILFGNDSIFLCLDTPCRLGLTEPAAVDYDNYKHLETHTSDLTNLIVALIMFLLPMILLAIFASLFIKYIIIAIALTGAGMLFLRIVNKRLSPVKVFKIAIYALTFVIVLDTISLPFALNLYYVPLFISVVYFVVGLMLASERGFK